MVALLAPQLPANVTLVEQDVLETDLAALMGGGPVRVAGNLPYNVSSPILFRLLDAHRRYGCVPDATLMLQREVADRIEAKPGTKDYGVLSIFVQLHADVRRVLSLPPGAFRPAPKVRSAVTRFTFRPPAVTLADEGVFNEMVRSMFTQRRKTLSNALAPFARGRRELRGRGAAHRRHRRQTPSRNAATHRTGSACGLFRCCKKPSCAIVPSASVPAGYGATSLLRRSRRRRQVPGALSQRLAGRTPTRRLPAAPRPASARQSGRPFADVSFDKTKNSPNWMDALRWAALKGWTRRVPSIIRLLRVTDCER